MAKKETYYFSHDCNARNDEKILMLRADKGMEGYGIYWALLEMMFENTETQLSIDKIKGIAFHLNLSEELLTEVLDICLNLKLFESDSTTFWSDSLRKRKAIYTDSKNKKSEAGKKGMAKRWESDNTVITEDNTVITEDNSVITEDNKGKESKGKESKGKENKEEENKEEENKEEENKEEENKEDNLKNKFSDDSLELKISQYLFEKILANDSKFKKPNLQKWAEHIDKLIRIDKRNDNTEIKQVIDFATNDSFWKSNILSTNKLREHYPNLLLQMNSNNKQSYYKPDPTVKNELEEKAINELMNKRLRLVK